MSGLARAIGALIKLKTDIPTFGDESANREKKYPFIEVQVVAEEEMPVGPGRNSHYTKNSSGAYNGAVKRMIGEARVQLTVKADQTTTESSLTVCKKIVDDLRKLFREVKYGREVVSFVDPKTNENQGVFRLNVGEAATPRLDIAGEPINHEGTLDLQITRRILRTETVLTTINHVANDHGA